MNDGLLRGPLTTDRGKPLTLRVLVLEPACPAAVTRARQVGESPESFARAAALSEAKLRDLAAHSGVNVEAYRYTAAPIWRIFRTGDTMFVGTFDALLEGHHSPVYRLPERVDGTLYRAFRRVIEETVAGAVRVI